VKILGHWIEPGEIEVALLRHPSVRQAVVTVCADNRGKHLTACLVPFAESCAETGDLRKFLRQTLPDYMVPSRFLWFEQLPLTANGKVDRRALTEIAGETVSPSRMAAPRTPVEKVLAGICGEVLGIGDFGIEDNFFEMGGHSLLVAQVVARVGARLKVQLPLRAMFEHPTVATLAVVLERARHDPRVPLDETITRRAGPRKRARLPLPPSTHPEDTRKLVPAD